MTLENHVASRPGSDDLNEETPDPSVRHAAEPPSLDFAEPREPFPRLAPPPAAGPLARRTVSRSGPLAPWRGLIAFWLGIILAGAIGAASLQVLGPLRPTPGQPTVEAEAATAAPEMRGPEPEPAPALQSTAPQSTATVSQPAPAPIPAVNPPAAANPNPSPASASAMPTAQEASAAPPLANPLQSSSSCTTAQARQHRKQPPDASPRNSASARN